MAITVYQATEFYADIVQALAQIEYPSLDIVREILIAMSLGWLRGSGTRVTPKSCAMVINAVMDRKKCPVDPSTASADRLIHKALQTLSPVEDEESSTGNSLIYASGGTVCPMANIDGLGNIIAPVGPDGPFVMNLNKPIVVFEDVDHMTHVINDWWDAVIGIESIRTRREGRVIPQSYAGRVIRELQNEWHEQLRDQDSRDGN